MEQERPDESGKSTGVWDGKRPYSFDEFDDEPPVQPKLRRFTSSSHRLQVRVPEQSDLGRRAVPPEILQLSDTVTDTSDSVVALGQTRGMCDVVNKENVASSDLPNNLGDNAENKTNGTPVKVSLIPGADNESETNLNRTDGKVTDRNRGVSDPGQSQERASQQQGSGQELDGCHGVLYVYSQQLIDHCNLLPRIPDRAGMVHSLIEALGLLKYLIVAPPKQAEEEEVMKFHSREYIEFLQSINHQDDEEKIDHEDAEQYGLTYDCPVQRGVYDCAALVAGATVMAAEALCDGRCHVAINWCGGWHHAQRSEASGFCYINDIVLGILKLRHKFSRVLYVDLDLHHGDGVENAFSTTPHVMTVSFHKYGAGFFPGSGNVDDVGSRGDKYCCVNVPLKDGISDAEFFSIFKRVMTSVHESYAPEVIVCQCGADGLAGDPMSSFNLTLTAYRHCLYFLLQWKLPLLLLGGGGYHHANTARCWASLTALMVGRKLPQDVPDHKHFTDYGPGYELTVQAGNRKNHNSLHDLTNICRIIRENLEKMKAGSHEET